MQGDVLNVVSASRLMAVSANQDETRSSSVPSTIRPPGYPKAGDAEGRVQERLRCKSRYGILPRKSVDRRDR